MSCFVMTLQLSPPYLFPLPSLLCVSENVGVHGRSFPGSTCSSSHNQARTKGLLPCQTLPDYTPSFVGETLGNLYEF